MHGEALEFVEGGFKLMKLLQISLMLEFALSNASDTGIATQQM